MKWLTVFIFSLVSCLMPATGWASTVSKVKGDRALIATEGTNLEVGQTYYTVDRSGKKKSIVKIVAVKSNQAVGQLVKGQIAEGQTLLASAIARKSAKPQRGEEGRVAASDLSRFGVLVSYLINNMSAKFTYGGANYTTNMKGNGFGALGYYDYGFSQKFDARLAVGFEQFQVAESLTKSVCDKGSSTTCNAIINYLSGYALGKYNVIDGGTRWWVGAGGGLLYAVSKTSTILDSSQISTNTVITASSGVEFGMKGGSYLPVVLEYSFFPGTSDVTANYIAIRVGWGWR